MFKDCKKSSNILRVAAGKYYYLKHKKASSTAHFLLAEFCHPLNQDNVKEKDFGYYIGDGKIFHKLPCLLAFRKYFVDGEAYKQNLMTNRTLEFLKLIKISQWGKITF